VIESSRIEPKEFLIQEDSMGKIFEITAFILMILLSVNLFMLLAVRSSPPQQIVQHPQTANHPDKQNEAKQEKPLWQRFIDDPIIILTLFLVIFNGVLAYATYRQLGLTEEAINASRQSLRISERAWMGITSIIWQGDIGNPMIVDVTFKNIGKSIARNVTIVITGENVAAGKAPNYSQVDTIKPTSNGIAAPGTEIHAHTMSLKPLNKELWEAFLQGKGDFFAYGIIRYDDIFDRHHWMTYCYHLDRESMRYMAYMKYNETDKDQFN
jgi:hypothetical protein